MTPIKANGRDDHGCFAIGSPGGPGRPPIERERRYAETLASVCKVDDWLEICRRAVEDAKVGDHRAREWLSKYLIGEPQTQIFHGHIHANADHESPYLNASTDVIIEALTAIDRVKESDERNRLITVDSSGDVRNKVMKTLTSSSGSKQIYGMLHFRESFCAWRRYFSA